MNRRDASGFVSFYKAPIAQNGNTTLSGDSGNGAYAGDDAVGPYMHGNFRFTWGTQLDAIRGSAAGIAEFQPPQQPQQGGPSIDPNVMLNFLGNVAKYAAARESNQ
ncbi:hypothetical protein [Granulicella sp. S190]|uniref:hypothetical protein n=1 Tax=Granulicella sp. S190 TaxID=1747226 RepID=UPI00131CEFDE|nr:hypothetical protein [Granulicella sp. S190]